MMDIDRINDMFTYCSACVGRSIRLLRLLPGSGTDQLALFLEVVDLDSSELSFAAISYVWGNATDTGMALCDGKVIVITQSLYSALWQLREDRCTGYIWADAICINQTDTIEKTEQVRMMGDIYANAELVFIWLGEATENDRLGLALMTHICELLDEYVPEDSVPPDLVSLGLTNLHSLFWSSMREVLQRPWFWRAWVVQEYYRAQRWIFQCGQLTIPSNILFGVYNRICNHPGLKILYQMRGGQTMEDRDMPDLTGPFFEFVGMVLGEMSLVEILFRARNLKSTDRRDRLFALVGLSSDTSSSLIDYGRDFDEILRQIATAKIRELLNGPDPCNIFRFLSTVHKKDSVEGRTSWAPSFELPAPFRGLGSIFKNEKPLKTTPQMTFRDSKFLWINGRVIDQVKNILYNELNSTPGAQIDPENPGKMSEQYRKILDFQAKISEFVHLQSTYPTGEDLNDVFWRSVIFDTEDLGRRASLAMRENFASYQESLALAIVWIEHRAGKFSEASPEQVLEELLGLFPQLKWRPSSRNEMDANGPDVWNQIKGYIDEKTISSMAFSKAIGLFAWDRMYFASELGYLGWVPCHTQEGDRICAFSGSRLPFVIRPCEEGFRLIGACYMHGIMEGEACELSNLEGDDDVMITLV